MSIFSNPNTYLNQRVLSVILKVKEKFSDLKTTIKTAGSNYALPCNTDCYITLCDSPFTIHIQTKTTGSAFCESSLLKNFKKVYSEELKYRDIMHHASEEHLEEHLIWVFSNITEMVKKEGSLIHVDTFDYTALEMAKRRAPK